MNELRQAAASMRHSAGEMVRLTSELPEEVVRWKPAPDVWSIAEIVCHVEEAVTFWLEDFLAVVAAPGTEWGRNHHHEGRLAAVARADSRSLSDALGGVCRETDRAAAAFAALTDDALDIESPCRNPRFRPTMRFLVEHLLVQHMEKHVGQIERNLRQYRGENDGGGQ